MKVFCLDTETSAGMRDGKVMQLAIVDELYRGEWLVNPDSFIQPGCIAVHKITPEMVEDKPVFTQSEGYSELMKRIDAGEILIAHHAPFDITILANEGVHIENYICSCKVARKILKPDGVPKFGLQFLREYLRLEELNADDKLTGYAHSALYDTVVLYWLYKYLYEKIEIQYPGENPHKVMFDITHDVAPTTRLSFGKHKGQSLKKIAETDIGYLKWLYASEMETPPAKRKKSLLIGLEKYI